MNTIICRPFYCEHCYQNHSPKIGDQVLLYGHTSKEFLYLEVTNPVHKRNLGFTPHLFVLKRVKDEFVFYYKICSICGAGVEIIPVLNHPEKFEVRASLRDQTLYKMTIQNWQALWKWRDDSYRIV